MAHGYEPRDSFSYSGLSEETDTLQENFDIIIPSVHLWIIAVIFSILSAFIIVIIGYGCFYRMCNNYCTRSNTTDGCVKIETYPGDIYDFSPVEFD